MPTIFADDLNQAAYLQKYANAATAAHRHLSILQMSTSVALDCLKAGQLPENRPEQYAVIAAEYAAAIETMRVLTQLAPRYGVPHDLLKQLTREDDWTDIEVKPDAKTEDAPKVWVFSLDHKDDKGEYVGYMSVHATREDAVEHIEEIVSQWGLEELYEADKLQYGLGHLEIRGK